MKFPIKLVKLIASYCDLNTLFNLVKVNKYLFEQLKDCNLVTLSSMFNNIQHDIPLLTQMELNNFHRAGIGRKSVCNLGVPRIKELINRTTSG